MTVDKIPDEESGHYEFTWKGLKTLRWYCYRCVWFDGNELKSGDFEEHVLVAANTELGLP